MTQQAFWKPEPVAPVAPDKTWIARLLTTSLWVSGVGWAITGLFAFAFDDIRVIPILVQSWLVVIGSGLVVIGAEMNTGPTAVAVFRKLGNKSASRMDVQALVASLVGSVASILITFAIRQTRFGESWWRNLALSWGPLVAGIAVACDYYAASAELGLLKSDFERAMSEWFHAMEVWLQEEQEWNEAHGIVPAVDRSTWRKATIHDVRRLAAELNGDRAGVTAVNLQEYLDPMHVRVEVADTTMARWLKELENGG